MAAQTWIEVHRRTLVVVKPIPPQEPARLEAGWLQRAADHPVVRLMSDGSEPRLVTGFAGSATALTGSRPPVETAHLLAAVARALGALHRDRLVHGNLTGDHIVVDGPRFALCSPDGSAQDPGVDVVAFAPLIELLVRRWEPDLDPDLGAAWRQVGLVAAEGVIGADRLAARLGALAERSARARRWNFPRRR